MNKDKQIQFRTLPNCPRRSQAFPDAPGRILVGPTGCVVSAKMVERTITNFVRQSFYDGQVSIALICIRPAQFVEIKTTCG